mgnify:CR=1 FL=1
MSIGELSLTILVLLVFVVLPIGLFIWLLKGIVIFIRKNMGSKKELVNWVGPLMMKPVIVAVKLLEVTLIE